MPSVAAKVIGVALVVSLAIVSTLRLLPALYPTPKSFPNYQVQRPTTLGSPIWDMDLGPNVRMLVENTLRYQINTDEGAHEWERLVPSDGGVVYPPSHSNSTKYTISMFHQLRCLNVVRLELTRPSRFSNITAPNERQVKHCLNYLRQMALCRSDPDLENPTSPTSVDIVRARTCKDWRTVYERQAEGARA
ncbi:hypothetical protein SCHPADRAFT_910615 [Schizopora paradoxa]|uniref:Uncharacterized protein n=1 Tax=Schizopora paradoxa TaxID=27342 RepID=A0A0H2R980_9AGAM|nr:hypothetical protein SCHPADRAFT_910615 [Schizopora paradoxa]